MPGTLTRAQLGVEVRAGLGNRVDPNLNESRIDAALNLAQQRIGRFYNWQDTNKVWSTQQVMTNNPATDKWLALPPRVKVIHSLVLQDGGNSRKLKEKPWRMFDANVPLPEYGAPDWPQFYTRFGFDVIMLFPTPLSPFIYQSRSTMLATPFVFTNLTQVSDFIDKDDIIISLAVAYFHRSMGRPDLAAAHEGEALQRLTEAMNSAEDRPDMDISQDDFYDNSGGAYWMQPFTEFAP